MDGGKLLVESLAHLGVKYIFANTGTDHAPIIEAAAEREANGIEFPKMITVPHEGPAVAMAHGYYLASRKPQVTLVHTTPGSANALANLMNASSSKTPIILMAGRSPITEKGKKGSRALHIHWHQEARDQGSIMREFMKWDYELREAEQIPSVLARGYGIAMASPPGPVYVILPRERLCSTVEEPIEPPKIPISPGPHGNPDTLRQASTLLAKASAPLIITRYLGRNPDAVKPLVELAERLGAKVIQTVEYLNFPTDHPLSLGGDPAPHLPDSDVILLVDVDIPWIPDKIEPSKDAKIIHIDLDPYHERIPVWSFPCDLMIEAESRYALESINRLLDEIGVDDTRRWERFEKAKRMHDARLERLRERAEKGRKERPIAGAWLAACVNELMARDDAILVSESGSIRIEDLLLLNRPGSVFRIPPFGSLGWGLGASLGVKLASPDKLVIAVLGDGAYMYNSPVACHFVANKYNLPVLTIIVNNAVWNASMATVKSLYPDGWAVKTQNFPGCELTPSPRFEKVAESCGAHAERVEDPDDLRPALSRALESTLGGRQALVNVICSLS